MSLLLPPRGQEVTLRLARDLVRVIKRGNPWVFADALRDTPRTESGRHACLADNKRGKPFARGFYDPESQLAFRVCNADDDRPLNDEWARQRFETALKLRRRLFEPRAALNRATNGFRLFNGEGDGLPGLVVDIYADVAVIKLDGPGPSGFWDAVGIADWLRSEVPVTTVIQRQRERGSEASVLIGNAPAGPVEIVENGMKLTVDVQHGQKTGFFLDQRDNRWLVREMATGTRLLNLFGYTGGFSIAGGIGGARRVTTVDLAKPAIEAANAHWALNGLPADQHEGVAADAFDFLQKAKNDRRTWDFVISDPPSFAPSKQTVAKASAAYFKLATDCASVTSQGGLLALASCSSHFELPDFLKTCEEGISGARRRATMLASHSQPIDHPTPLALPEFRYLKFLLFQLD